jgi:F-type H+-transporting ATPase subunit delta
MADLATIARPYAEALISSAKPEEMELWTEQLNTFGQMASNPEVAMLSNNPNVSQEQLTGLLMASLKKEASSSLQKFITLITMNHRVAALPEIAKQFEELKNARAAAAEIKITSAFPMSEQELASLVSSLSKKFGNKTLKPILEIDPELIGGVRVQVGDEVLDTSVKARLEAMQSALLS